MRYLSKGAVLASLVAVALGTTASPALAAQTSNSEFVIIREGDTFPGDLYAGAIRVIVEGTIEGDLVAFAAEEIVINGAVTGSVTAVTPRLSINGEIGQSVRHAGSSLEVTGDIGGDIVAAALDAELSPTSNVTGDALIWSWRASALGTIGADLVGTQRHLELAGAVAGDVDVSVTRLTVVDELEVRGDLGFRSTRDVVGIEMATVGGATVAKTPLPPNLRIRALALLGRSLVILFLSVAALSTAYGWPRRTMAAMAGVGERPVRKWLMGALILFSPGIAVAITALILGLAPAAAAFPLLIALIPLIAALAGLVFALTLVAGVPTVGWLGGVLFKRLDLYGATLVGSLLVGIVWYLPVVGWLIPIVILPWGLGAWMATWNGHSPELAPNEATDSLRA